VSCECPQHLANEVLDHEYVVPGAFGRPELHSSIPSSPANERREYLPQKTVIGQSRASNVGGFIAHCQSDVRAIADCLACLIMRPLQSPTCTISFLVTTRGALLPCRRVLATQVCGREMLLLLRGVSFRPMLPLSV
jgi:hypothetical protein